MDRRLADLRILHQLDNAVQTRITTCTSHFKVQRAVAIHRAAQHLRTDRLGHRDMLARDHTLIHRARAMSHNTVRRNLLARHQLDHVADLQQLGRNHALRIARQNSGLLRRQLHQTRQCLARVSLGRIFQVAAQRHKRYKHSRRIEKRLGLLAARPRASQRDEHRCYTERPRRHRADNHECVHRHGPVPNGFVRRPEKALSHAELDWQREKQA